MSMLIEIVTDGLSFPEGPIWMEDGTVIVMEAWGSCITRVYPDGRKERVADIKGGPNGGAIGPDGAIYVCNNGGMIGFGSPDGVPGHASLDYETGSIDRVDIATGKVERLYDTVDGRRLAGPNDIIFDSSGGFWFSDFGKTFGPISEAGGIFYALPDGRSIMRVVDYLNTNGIGLSPDESRLYVSCTDERQVIAFDIVSPGVLAPQPVHMPGEVVASFLGRQLLDSLAVTADGHVCVGSLIDRSGIAVVDPVARTAHTIEMPDPFVTNICFGGADMQDAWLSFSGSGSLARCRWDRPGQRLPYYA